MKKEKRFLLIISILIVNLLILTSCGGLITKIDGEAEKEVVEVEGLEEKEGQEEEVEEVGAESSNISTENRIAIVDDADLSRLDESLPTPADLREGDVVYIDHVEEGVAFVEVIRFFGEAVEDFSFVQGYIPLENLILNPTEEDFEDEAKTFRLKSGIIKGRETITNLEIEIEIEEGAQNIYTEALEEEDDYILIPQAGGAHSVWISKDDVDFDFSGFEIHK